MQTKKRAKSVTFGKKKVEKETPKETAPIELEKKPVVVVHSHKVEEETDVTSSYPSDDEPRTRIVRHETESIRDEDEDHEEYVSIARKDDLHDEDEETDYDEHERREREKLDEELFHKSRDEDETIEPAEDVLSKPFPSVHKDREELPEDDEEPEHPKIFGKHVDHEDTDDRYEEDRDEDKTRGVSRSSEDRYYEDEEPERSTPSDESTFKGFTLSPEERRTKRSGGGNAGFFIIVTFLAFLFGLSGIIGFYYISKYQDLDVSKFLTNFTAEPTPTSEPTEAPTPTEAPVDLEAYTIKVLNGSGITGEAAKEKTALIDGGFKVGTTGNADNSDYTQTVIAAKKDIPEGYIKKLREQLEKTYSVESSVQTLSENPEGVDVIVTIGSMGAK